MLLNACVLVLTVNLKFGPFFKLVPYFFFSGSLLHSVSPLRTRLVVAIEVYSVSRTAHGTHLCTPDSSPSLPHTYVAVTIFAPSSVGPRKADITEKAKDFGKAFTAAIEAKQIERGERENRGKQFRFGEGFQGRLFLGWGGTEKGGSRFGLR
ncbi:uncharacterized protein G2W53_022068 [Senna tora]|uniref:Uncharacterized protein n=1 Tax=Senna tora TaxID=362788 RepID=A0A834WNV6_9FABA|nr:uncharacterized protein G2W53_022068 [Senna tora]